MALNPNYLVYELIAKVTVPQVYGEKVVKPAVIACANGALGEGVVSLNTEVRWLSKGMSL